MELSVDPTDKDYLLPGMSCTVKLIVLDKPSVLTVPSNALHQNAAGEMFVRTRGANGTIVNIVVKIGSSHGGKTEITEGLKDGDEILLP